MQCAHCGKSDWVTIGNKKYCANCGEPAEVSSASNSNAPKPGGAVTDLKAVAPTPAPKAAPAPHSTPTPKVAVQTHPTPAAKPPLEPAKAPAPAAKPVPAHSIAPADPKSFEPAAKASSAPVPVMSDVTRPKNSDSQTIRTVNPANSFHTGPAPAGVLDLRQLSVKPADQLQQKPIGQAVPASEALVAQPAPAAAPPPPPQPQPQPLINADITPVPVTPAPITPAPQAAPPAAATPMPAPAPTPQPTPTPQPLPQPISPILAVSKPMPAAAPAPAQASPVVIGNRTIRQAPAPTPVAPGNPATPGDRGQLIQKFIRPGTALAPGAPASAQAANPNSGQFVPQGVLNHVTTQIDAMQRFVPPAAVPSTNVEAKRENALQMALAAAPSAKSVMAATLAIAIMGGYIWVNNYNTLSIKSAGKKAGIEASLPGYMPNSFNLGPVAYGQGFISLQYKSPSSPDPLTITQRKTDWDSASLLEMYVNSKANSYVSVANQGLTIYLFNGNQATWVNKGLQYVIEGNTHLSRDQIIKIAESL